MSSERVAGRGAVGMVGIVLAGGRSSRFAAATIGASSKLDADLGGRAVLERTISALADVADEVVVAGRAMHADGARRPGVRYVVDGEPFGGPAAGVRAGLAASEREVAVVVGGDMPFVRVAVLRLLAARLADDPAAGAALLAVGDDPQPLPLALRRGAALEAAIDGLAAGDRSLLGLVRRLGRATIPEAEWRALDPDADTVFDIDTPADLAAARRRLG